MAYRVTISPIAHENIDEAIGYYNDKVGTEIAEAFYTNVILVADQNLTVVYADVKDVKTNLLVCYIFPIGITKIYKIAIKI